MYVYDNEASNCINKELNIFIHIGLEDKTCIYSLELNTKVICLLRGKIN